MLVKGNIQNSDTNFSSYPYFECFMKTLKVLKGIIYIPLFLRILFIFLHKKLLSEVSVTSCICNIYLKY